MNENNNSTKVQNSQGKSLTKFKKKATNKVAFVPWRSGSKIAKRDVNDLKLCVSNTLMGMYEIGGRLNKMKAAVKHGEWLDVLNEVGLNRFAASKFMRVEREMDLKKLKELGSMRSALKWLKSPSNVLTASHFEESNGNQRVDEGESGPLKGPIPFDHFVRKNPKMNEYQIAFRVEAGEVERSNTLGDDDAEWEQRTRPDKLAASCLSVKRLKKADREKEAKAKKERAEKKAKYNKPNKTFEIAAKALRNSSPVIKKTPIQHSLYDKDDSRHDSKWESSDTQNYVEGFGNKTLEDVMSGGSKPQLTGNQHDPFSKTAPADYSGSQADQTDPETDSDPATQQSPPLSSPLPISGIKSTETENTNIEDTEENTESTNATTDTTTDATTDEDMEKKLRNRNNLDSKIASIRRIEANCKKAQEQLTEYLGSEKEEEALTKAKKVHCSMLTTLINELPRANP